MRHTTSRLIVIGVLTVTMAFTAHAAPGDWPTARGNAQRTGNVDGKAGPAAPKVLWAQKGTEHYLASPVAGSGAIYLSSLGAFNASNVVALKTGTMEAKRVLWGKSTPYLKLPVASAPAVSGGYVVFGDGMHQTSGAILHCLRADTGQMTWQYAVPGDLVHMEGSPTIADGRVFIGGGNAGVICVDLNRVTLEGKELELAAVKEILDKKWKELLAKYEEDKKKDPDFAVPPSENDLPKPAPRLVWQQGKGKWHVDAAVNVVGDKVLVATAYLDDEKHGERAIYCLSAKDGSTLWKQPLKFNPWAGASVADGLVVVAGSNIRFDPKLIAQGQGEITAFDLADGKPRWAPRPVKGGVVSSVALQGGLALFTATDGKLRAINLADGRLKWTYDAKAPFFAGAAVTSSAVYVADLKGVVHALNLIDGRQQWTLDLGADPAIKAPGMVYGSPIVDGGRLYVATCNVEGDNSRQATAVVCLGGR